MPAPDSGILLYCIGRAGASGPVIRGVRDLPLRWIEERSLAALVSDGPPRDVITHPQVADLLGFERAVASAHASGDALPVRFGCILGDEEQLRDLLRERAQIYQNSLARVAGCVEMGVRVELKEAPPEIERIPDTDSGADTGRPSSGAAYLRARQTHYLRIQRAQARSHGVSTRLQQTFAGLFREAQVLPAAGTAEAEHVSVAFLVERAAVEAFRTRFASLQSETAHKHLNVLLGPWPPFSFSAESASSPPEASTHGG